MTMWGNICRICSSPADYEVFAKIPTYLHANSSEFLNWQKPINILLEETTGLMVTTDDGLPRFICALCISYLKHAACFREQAISNALGLKAVQALNEASKDQMSEQQFQRNNDKEGLFISAKDLNFCEDRKTDTNLLYSSENRDKVHKQLLNNASQQPTQRIADNEHVRYLNLLFDKANNITEKRDKCGQNTGAAYEVATGSDPFAEDFQTASSDDNEASEQKLNYFSYREKNFEEDDIMDLDELKDVITVNIPESCKERKCRACFRRFMFEDSYKEHIEACIEYKFLTTIEEINRLLDIRRGKAISPHEFIRRMIFCLRKTGEWLKANCGETLLPDLLQNGDGGVKKRTDSEGKSSTADASSGAGGSKAKEGFRAQKLTISERLAKAGEIQNKAKMTDFTFNSSFSNNDLLSGVNFFASPKPISHTATPIPVENNVLYEIERSQKRSKQETASRKATTPVPEQERITFLQKLQNAASTPLSTPISKCETFPHVPNATPLITVRKDLLPSLTGAVTPNKLNLVFSARCNLCSTLFATVAELEEHNAVYHNAQQLQEQKLKEEMNEHEKIIALFEESSEN